MLVISNALFSHGVTDSDSVFSCIWKVKCFCVCVCTHVYYTVHRDRMCVSDNRLASHLVSVSRKQFDLVCDMKTEVGENSEASSRRGEKCTHVSDLV